MQIKILSGANVIADADLERTATGDGTADYKGWLVELGIGGGGRRRAFSATGIDRSKGAWRTLLQILVEAHRELMSPQEFRDLIRGPRLCRARKHRWTAAGGCKGCHQDRQAEMAKARQAKRAAREKGRVQDRINKLNERLAAARRDLEALGTVAPLALPLASVQRPYTVSQAVVDARKANLEKARAARAAKAAAAVASG